MNVQSQSLGAVNIPLLWGSQQFQQHICKQLLMFTPSSAAQLPCKSLAQMHYSSKSQYLTPVEWPEGLHCDYKPTSRQASWRDKAETDQGRKFR